MMSALAMRPAIHHLETATLLDDVWVLRGYYDVEARLLAWAAFVAGWIVVLVVTGRSRVGLSRGLTPTDSLVERFGIFAIVVLGEVVFGVVNGLFV